MTFDAKAKARSLLSSPCAKGRPDFADRAASCHLLTAHQPYGVDMLTLWPGRLEDLAQGLTPAQHRALALAILAEDETPAKPAAKAA